MRVSEESVVYETECRHAAVRMFLLAGSEVWSDRYICENVPASWFRGLVRQTYR